MTTVSWWKANGFRICAYSVQSNSTAADYGGGSRSTFRRKGGQCMNWVSRELQAERGLPICNAHWPLYQRAVEEDAERRAALRRKYDPGPLPLD